MIYILKTVNTQATIKALSNDTQNKYAMLLEQLEVGKHLDVLRERFWYVMSHPTHKERAAHFNSFTQALTVRSANQSE